MTFADYVRDKAPFLLFAAGLTAFVALMMAVSGVDSDTVLYTASACLVFTVGYAFAGYAYRRAFYRELELSMDAKDAKVDHLPRPQTRGQGRLLAFVRHRQDEHEGQLRRLRAEIREHQDFVMSWIHEVKLPIAAARLLLAREEALPEALADKLEDEIGKIDSYVEQALYFSRIDSFSRDYYIAELPLQTLVKASVRKYAKLFINKRIAFEIQEGELRAHSDGKWLAFIVEQIMANALKYTPEQGRIAAGWEEDAAEKRLWIEDNGIGIPPEELGRVFDKGFTGTNGRSHAKSTGLGLYLARQMALKLGHRLSVRSEPGAGTRLTIHFPKFRSYNDIGQP
ncbi:sensor histidine kinase [Cohnella sp. JJ-181]|uniref:sensor histidine kinase n=1 Tax=Cohnella rhizoplanae TaxID=2974897 RepID=UPI0022FF7B56|nr:sensor histidine kinase [Cohnella sp. JJ-181]CAI6083870.1 Sensor histidine kinase GraS [Cohnella sp. JJ-181]